MTALIGTQVLGKRHRRLWALADCTPSAPGGRVAGLVGPNGAGKATLLSLAAGLIEPARGMIEVLCGPPPANPPQLARAGFVARDAPVYAGLPVAGHLALGAHLNPRWDEELARGRAGQLDLNPGQKARTLSGGQRARLALTLAIGKRPWAADPRRTSGQPGTAGPAGVPAGPDGGQRRVLIGLTAMAVTEGLSLMFGWWAAPIGQAARLATGNAPIGSPFSPRSFDALGIAPLGYAALAFVLAVTAGLLIQRVVPAMAVTLVRLAPAGPGGASAAASCGGGTRPDCQRKGWR